MFKRLLIAIESIAESFKSLSMSLKLMQEGQAKALSRVPNTPPDPAQMVKDLMKGFGKEDLLKNIGNGGKQ